MKILTAFLITALSLFVNTIAFCQSKENETDSLRKLLSEAPVTKKARLLYQLAYRYEISNLDSSMYYAAQLTSWATAEKSKAWLAASHAQLAANYLNKGLYDSVVHYAESSIALFIACDSLQKQLWPIRTLGFAFDDLGQHENAIRQYLIGLEIADSLNMDTERIKFFSSIGDSYRSYKDSKSAVDYLEKAYSLIYKIPDNKHLQFAVMHNLALAYDLANMREKSIQLYKRLTRDSVLRQSSRHYSMVLTNLSRSYILLHQYDSAKKYLDIGISLRKKINSSIHSAYAYKEYASLYKATGLYEKSIEYGHKVRKIGEETGQIGHLEDAYRNLRDAYYANKEYKNSADFSLAYSKVQREKYNNEKQKLIVEMEAKYETVQKEKEIDKLEAQKIIDQKTKKILIGGIIFVGTSTLLIALLLWSAFQKQKTAKTLALTQLSLQNKDLEIKTNELSHFVRIVHEKNELVQHLESQISASDASEEEKTNNIDKLTKSIILTNEDWQKFKATFEEVHSNFFTKLKTLRADLTESELRLAALIKLNLSTKEISSMLGISRDSVTRAKYRVKKKLEVVRAKELEHLVASV